jgi:hypothetical protein
MLTFAKTLFGKGIFHKSVPELKVVGDSVPERTGNAKTKRVHFQNENVQQAFPTDERVEWKKRQKEMKELGLEPNKRKKVVEDHHDDCGADISGLGPADDQDLLLSVIADELDSDEPDELLVRGLNTFWLKGSEWVRNPRQPKWYSDQTYFAEFRNC